MRKPDPPPDATRRYDELKDKPKSTLTIEERQFITDYYDSWGYTHLEKNCKDCYWEDWQAYNALRENPSLDPDHARTLGVSVKCRLYGWIPEERTGCPKYLISDF